MLQWYESFLLSNASQITAVESSLRSITYFLPGRFPDSELAGEAVYSALNLLGLYHDSILVRLLSPRSMPRSIGVSSSSSRSTINSSRSTSALQASATPQSVSTTGAPAPPATYSKLQHTPSEHARYTHHFSDSSSTYSRLARVLVIIGYVELLSEMLARRKLGPKKAWDVVVGIESVKAVLRLALLRLTETRTSIQPPIPEREVDPAMLEEDRKATLANALQPSNEGPSGSTSSLAASAHLSGLSPEEQAQADVWRGSRTGLTRPTLTSIHQRAHPGANQRPPQPNGIRSRHPLASRRSALGTASPSLDNSGSGSGSDSDETLVDSWTEKDVNDYLMSRTLTPNDVKKPEDLVRKLKNGMGVTAELIWILRPLLYVLALRRWGRRHKTPFFLSLGMEYLARLMRIRALTPPGASISPSPLANPLLMAMMGDSSVLSLLAKLTGSGAKEARPISEVEKQEWEKRSRAFWWYLLRGPAWYSFTRPKLESLASKTEARPLLGIIGGIVRDYLPLVDDYYYYSST
ncbi:peroxisome membrane protein [Meira miltonrushii]|uniref:Peroxisomal membrane protein PEX16 n=1 Tax=Meira miltonrushii TaxID=1280837 RepID=A0A316VHL8_9BASI|nr:peroxisome membrane protein [Meira miltonrushii]PWN35481.1 peroxisome membrane protein [Meira miltonrushii]